MKNLNSVVTQSKIQLHNTRNAFKFRSQLPFPTNYYCLYTSCSTGNGRTLTLSFTTNTAVFAQLKTSDNESRINKGKKKNKSTATKIEAPDPGGAPAVSGGGSGGDPKIPPPKVDSWRLKGLPKKVLSILSNLPLAIAEMFAVAALMAIGTFIEQGEAPDFYIQKYSENNPILGFFTWKWIFALGFDHMFSSPVFLATLTLLAASLMACTSTTQIPIVKVAKRWSFLQSAKSIRKQEYSDTLPRASIKDLGLILMGNGYEV